MLDGLIGGSDEGGGAGRSSERGEKPGLIRSDKNDEGEYLGGPYRELPGPKDTDRDIERHHLIPTWVLEKLGIKSKEGPALQMDKPDHAVSESTGSSRGAEAFRQRKLDKLQGEISVERSRTACRTWSNSEISTSLAPTRR